MMKSSLLNQTKYLLFFMITFSFYVNASQDEPMVRLKGHIPKEAVAKGTFLKNIDDDKEVNLTFMLPLRNQDELDQFLERVYDPASKDFGKFLTNKEFY